MKIYTALKLIKARCFNWGWGKYIVSFLLAFTISSVSFAHQGPAWRNFINPFHVNFSLGGGVNFYENILAGMYIYEQDGKYYLTTTGADSSVYLIRAVSQSYVRLKSYEDLTSLINPQQGNTKIIFKGAGSMLCVNLGIHRDLVKKLRIELGGSLMFNQIKNFKPNQEHAYLGEYQDPLGKHYKIRPFAKLGFKLFENSAYTLLFNAQASYDFTYATLSDTVATHRSLFPAAGLGFTLEKHISEYFSAFAHIMYDTGNFVEQFVNKRGGALRYQGIYLQVGYSLNYPEIPRCPIKTCSVEVKHKHGNKPYRGVSLFTGKNGQDKRLYEK
ncbi:MAG: hypothetical protein ACK4M7_05350 [Burkholderiales bacterium]